MKKLNFFSEVKTSVFKNSLVNQRILSVGVFLLLTTATPLVKAQSIDDLNKQADVAESKGDFDSAISYRNAVLQIDPKNYRAYVNRGNDYRAKGNNDKALEDYSTAIEIDPKLAVAYVNRGAVYHVEGNDDKALQDCDEAIHIDPKLAAAYFSRAQAYRAKLDDQKSIEDLNETIRLDPTFAMSYLLRGEIYHSIGDYDKAIKDYTQQIKLDPKHAFAGYGDRANTYIALDDYPKAINDFNSCINLLPNYPRWFNAEAWIYATCSQETVRNGKKALELAKRACELSKWQDAEYIDTLAAAEAEVGKFDDAVKYEQQAIDATKAANANASDLEKHMSFYLKQKPFRDVK